MGVKVGDYGLAPMTFLEDYVPVHGENQPVRWMPPEILDILNKSPEDEADSSSTSTASSDSTGPRKPRRGYLRAKDIPWTRKNGMWSLAVTLWECAAAPRRPFEAVSDSNFVHSALNEPMTLAAQIGALRLTGTDAEAVQSVLDLCLKPDPKARPDCDRLRSYFEDFYDSRMETSQARITQEVSKLPFSLHSLQ